MPPDDMDHRLERVRSSTARFATAMDGLGLTSADLRVPSLLPGWSRAHVLSHLARSADAVRRVTDAARVGEQVQMYPGGNAGREAEIVAGVHCEPGEILADVSQAAEALDKAWSAPADDPMWDNEVLHRTGPMPLSRMVSMRWREVEIHWVDLQLGYGPADWPAEFVTPLLPSLAAPEKLGPRLPAGLAVTVEATDSGRVWTAGTGDTPTRLSAPSWALAAWLLGRSQAVTDALPDPPVLAAWL